MKRVLFLMFLLFLLVLGATSVKAQVRIGGNGTPNAAAVLDLNADDSATPATNKGALALPRVSLGSTTAQLSGSTPITGMLVYNTNASMTGGSGVGVYFYNGSNWIIISGDGIVGNEVTDATTGGGLVRAGAGTTASPYTLGIATGGVTSAMILDGTIATADIANGAVTGAKIATVPADSGKILMSNGSSWFAAGGIIRKIINNPLTVTTPFTAQPENWTVVADAAISVTFDYGAMTWIAIAGVLTGDLCKSQNADLLPYVISGNGGVYITSLQGYRGTYTLAFRCYRPNI